MKPQFEGLEVSWRYKRAAQTGLHGIVCKTESKQREDRKRYTCTFQLAWEQRSLKKNETQLHRKITQKLILN